MVDDGTSGKVDQERIGLHRAQLPLANQIGSLRCQQRIDGDEITLLQNGGEIGNLDPGSDHIPLTYVRIAGQQPCESQRPGKPEKLAGYIPAADRSQHGAVDVSAQLLHVFTPSSFTSHTVEREEIFGERKNHGELRLGDWGPDTGWSN